jgi:hypothetical protein
MSSVFAQKEYDDYFMRLPADLRKNLAMEVGYLVRSQTIGRICIWRFAAD